MSKEMNKQMNAQLANEFGAFVQYINIAAFFDNAGLPILARHFFKQAEEEHQHALRFVRYMLDTDATVAVPAIAAPRAEFASAEEAVALALEWELTVGKQINALLDRATSERDYTAHDFLEWFAREQLEEFSSMDTLLKMVRRAGDSGLMLVENALAAGAPLTAGGGQQEE